MLIIGVGHPMRGDDAAGPVAAERLAELGLEAIVLDGEGARLIHTWEGRGHVVVIDAADGGGPPGTLHVIDAKKEELASGRFHYSSHAFGLAEAVETSRVLGDLPERFTIYAITGADFTLGKGLSPDVADTVERVVERIAESAQAATSSTPSPTPLDK
ncbi:hydrogenase maturation protease [Rhodobium gokarnense]|uniref:Hydrogenase maturation protease n=1 Tax=Rhodobium gokarnense TaxID=364296 RepID=A0ABT3H9N2_9HYPH|nr:hydrogenase maturation protease [Rhodobium gokarnense]MCW2307108.1 hydrogenase maturation protease [Rhodobium gokarnense]